MKIHGIYCKSGAVVRVKIKLDDQSDPLPFQYPTSTFIKTIKFLHKNYMS